MSSLVLIFCDTKKHKKIKNIYICLKKLIIVPWLGSFFSSTTQQPTKEKNYNKKKKKLFHKFWSPLQFSQFWSPLLFSGGWAPSPSPPMGVLCGVQRYYNFSTLVDGDDFYLEYIILEHPLNRSSSSHNLHLRKQILMKRKQNLSQRKKKKKTLPDTFGLWRWKHFGLFGCDKTKVGHPKKNILLIFYLHLLDEVCLFFQNIWINFFSIF